MMEDQNRTERLVASTREALVYLYGIVPAETPAPPGDLQGIDGGPVSVRPIGRVSAVIGSVAADAYGDDSLDARLEDLVWVGDRGIAHERVLDWFAERGPVIPISLFSLHRDIERLCERVGAEEHEFARILDRLRGHREWGVKLWRRESVAFEGIDRLSPSLKQVAAEIAEAPPGKRFLLERRRDAMRKEELRSASKRITHELFLDLRRFAAAGMAIPLPGSPPGSDRALLLHAAFLVADAAFEDFRGAVSLQARELSGSGFEVELTGPWVPYHFSDPDDE